MNKSKRALSKRIFNEKTEVDFSFLKKDAEVAVAIGIPFKIKMIGATFIACILIIAIALICYFCFYTKEIKDNIFYFSQAELEHEEVDISTIPTEYKLIYEPKVGKLYRFHKNEQTVYFRQDINVINDYDHDEIVLIVNRSNIIVKDFENVNRYQLVEKNGVLVYFIVDIIDEFYYKYDSMFVSGKFKFFLKITTLDEFKFNYYISQLFE